jgi:hypothetical protein
MRVMIVIITSDIVRTECLASVQAQTHPDTSWIIAGHRPTHRHDNPVIQKYLNCSENRNDARRMALASDANAFLFLDSDIVIPPDAVSHFVLQHEKAGKEVQGGWYKMILADRWVCGKWVADHIFVNAKSPEPSLTQTDIIGCGCLYVSRTVLKDIEFEHGTDTVLKDELNNSLLLGECGAFGNRCYERNIPMFMNGHVICQHLPPQPIQQPTRET